MCDEDEEGLAPGAVDLSQRDPLFEEAARLIVNTQQGSTSNIQRKLSIGYNRAGRIVDQLRLQELSVRVKAVSHGKYW